jgi:glycosyltransferase involved in cell wall biosynthesis
MPSFNKAPHIERAIRSVLDQQAGFDELIIVDDGSRDSTLERIASFTDQRIRLLRRSQPGPGGYAARNLGIRDASSEWITFLDADDTWHPGFTQALADLIRTHGTTIGCAFTGFENLYPEGLRSPQRFGARVGKDGVQTLDFTGFLDSWLADKDCPIWTGATSFRKHLLMEAGLFPEGRCKRGGDKDLWLRTLIRSTAAYDPRVLATYHRDSVNMVTRMVGMNARHCVCDTILAMLANSNAKTGDRLKRLFNLEVYVYGIAAARAGQLDRATFEGFFVAKDPLKYLTLETLAASPRRLIDAARHLRRWVRQN